MIEKTDAPNHIMNNENAQQYEYHIGNDMAKIEYIIEQGKLTLTHTKVPKQLEGKGIASALAKYALEDIEKKELKLIPKCSFIASYTKRHPEWNKLLIKE